MMTREEAGAWLEQRKRQVFVRELVGNPPKAASVSLDWLERKAPRLFRLWRAELVGKLVRGEPVFVIADDPNDDGGPPAEDACAICKGDLGPPR